ncbi:light-inducible protein CPRF2 isoform X2 [Jatropha curcas]|uniref:light-inducible protein CPRF2 isoform X2 n=1 Tax=Jatropha curcas TaxID=180498 RepID=UPI001893C933|nr:light-inducible protein CPRF2 isoform X2 [Jatropha curcas]
MNSIFSVDDFSDLIWQNPVAAHMPAMSRSASEWELEKFLEEFPPPAHAPASSPASGNAAAPSSVSSQSTTLSKPRNVNDDVVEIEKAETPALPLPRNRPPQLSDRSSSAATDSEAYRASLKSQLDLACAAAAKSRESSVKPEGLSSLAEDQRVAAKNIHSGSQVSGNGHGIPKAQVEADGGSLRLPALTSVQRKQEVPMRQTTSGSSREDSDDDELDGDTETNEHLDPADEKRARRMQSNRESARRSRRRKQAQLNELEAQVGQLRDERTTLLTRLTDINKKCDDASVDNRILNANIETLRTKVKMAEDQVKRVTGLNPMLLARSNIPSLGMQFVAGQTDTSTNVAGPMQTNNNHFFHHSVPNITSGDKGTNNVGGMASMQQLTVSGRSMADAPPLRHTQKQTGPTASPAVASPASNKGISMPVAKDNKMK